MQEESGRTQREELLASIQRLSRTIQDRLELGIRDSSLTQSEIRMLGSMIVRNNRLWNEALEKERGGDRDASRSVEAEASNEQTQPQDRNGQA